VNITEKYLEAIKPTREWITISDWATKVSELYPDLLAKAEEDAKKQANYTTGLREIAARISSAVSRGIYADHLDVDASERPKKVRCATVEQIEQHKAEEVEEDVAPLRRNEIVKRDSILHTTEEKYRIGEIESVSKQLKIFFGLEFEVDHAQALLSGESSGKHHPDNFQLLLKVHNGKKNNKNWQRFTIEEQQEYIKAAVQLQGLIASRLSIDMTDSVLDSLLERLASVY